MTLPIGTFAGKVVDSGKDETRNGNEYIRDPF